MSRTYRRKNVPYYYTLDEALARYTKYGFAEISINDSEKEYWEDVRKFHSDYLQTMQQVPKWYKVQYLRRPYRAKVKAAMIKEKKKGYTGDVPMPVDKGRANYYW